MKISSLLLITQVTLSLNLAQAKTNCIAHAGNTEEEFRDSRAAFRSAYTKGADGIELDIRHTKDGAALIAHDSVLKDFANSKPAKSCPMNTEISKLNYQTIVDNCTLKNGEEFSSLREVFEEFKNTNLYLLLDLKDRPTKATLSMINYYAKHSKLKIRSLIKLASDLSAAMSLKARLRTPCYLTNNKFTPIISSLYDGVDVHQISDRAIKRLHRQGKTISLYGANDYNSLARAYRLNVELITTDALSICLQMQN